MKHEERLKHIKEIMRYAQYEGSEAGEYWQSLCDMGCRSDMMSEEFMIAYDKELEEVLKDLQENYEIAEEKKTHVVTYYHTRLIGDE